MDSSLISLSMLPHSHIDPLILFHLTVNSLMLLLMVQMVVQTLDEIDFHVRTQDWLVPE